jgi:hypothetical protein
VEIPKCVKDDVEALLYQIDECINDYDNYYHFRDEAKDIIMVRMRELIKDYVNPKSELYKNNIH